MSHLPHLPYLPHLPHLAHLPHLSCYRLRLKGTRNCSHMDPGKRDAEVDPKLSCQELRMPHKRLIHHTNRTPVCLEWSEHEPST